MHNLFCFLNTNNKKCSRIFLIVFLNKLQYTSTTMLAKCTFWSWYQCNHNLKLQMWMLFHQLLYSICCKTVSEKIAHLFSSLQHLGLCKLFQLHRSILQAYIHWFLVGVKLGKQAFETDALFPIDLHYFTSRVSVLKMVLNQNYVFK